MSLVFLSFKANRTAGTRVPKEGARKYVPSLEVRMWQFNDLLSQRSFSLRRGNDMPNETNTAGNSRP